MSDPKVNTIFDLIGNITNIKNLMEKGFELLKKGDEHSSALVFTVPGTINGRKAPFLLSDGQFSSIVALKKDLTCEDAEDLGFDPCRPVALEESEPVICRDIYEAIEIDDKYEFKKNLSCGGSFVVHYIWCGSPEKRGIEGSRQKETFCLESAQAKKLKDPLEK